MGKLLLIVLAAIAAFMLLGVVISALHFIFWVAVVALIVVVGLRLTGGARRWSRRYSPRRRARPWAGGRCLIPPFSGQCERRCCPAPAGVTAHGQGRCR